MSVDCDSEPYTTQQAISIIFLLSYGFGIPLGFCTLGFLLKKTKGDRMEQETFAFFMNGYRYQYRS